jgi:predicted lipoprotein with Yx(FWY)xxD motif
MAAGLARRPFHQISSKREAYMRHLAVVLVAATSVIANLALAQVTPTKIGESAKGRVLTNDQGMTLYVFDKDSPGKSACNDSCAGIWPPLMAAAASMAMGDYTIVARDDGSKQWAYKGRPLYNWKNDKKPGDITGDGLFNGVWHIAQP